MKTVLIIFLVVIVLGMIEKWGDKHLFTPRDGYTPETGARHVVGLSLPAKFPHQSINIC